MKLFHRTTFLHLICLLLALLTACGSAEVYEGQALLQYYDVFDGSVQEIVLQEDVEEEPEEKAVITPDGVFAYNGKANGFLLTVGPDGDLDPEDMPTTLLSSKLQEAAAYAAKHGFHTLYLQVPRNMESLLSDLSSYATSVGVQLVAVIPVLDATDISGSTLSGEKTYLNPNDDATRSSILDEIVSCYQNIPVAGILLTDLDLYGVDSPGNYTEGLGKLIRSIQKAFGKPVGLIFDGVEERTVTSELVSSLTSDGVVDVIYPKIYKSVSNGYLARLNAWISAASDSCDIYTVNAAYKVVSGDYGKREMLYEAFVNSIKNAVDGVVFQSYEDLLNDAVDFDAVAGILSEDNEPTYEWTDTSYAQSLSVCYPSQSAVTTTASAYWVMGTSNPNAGLTLNGNTVDRPGYTGCFGVLVNLAMGDNVLTFVNGNATETVTITRSNAGAVTTISEILSSTRFPSSDIAIPTGQSFSFTCTAPANATVKATFGSQTITLDQVVKGVQSGVAATYKGVVTLKSSSSIEDLGKVSYTLQYNGSTKNYTSEGKVYAVSATNNLCVEVTDYFGNVLSDPTSYKSTKGNFKEGVLVPIASCEFTDAGLAYKLKDGTYLLTESASFYPQLLNLSYTVSGGSISSDDGDECIRMNVSGSTGDPAVTAVKQGNLLTLRLYGGTVNSLPDVSSSDFVQTVEKGTFQTGDYITFTLKDGDGLWGYNLEYDEEHNIVLRLIPQPTLSEEYGKPLTGITVLLDPGHSGDDPGALGVAYLEGADEKDMNLALCRTIKYRLEQLGATVKMTHNGTSGRVVLSERMEYAEEVMPDIMLSIHHNSASLTKDLTSSNWMETYYYNENSKDFADSLLEKVNEVTGRAVKQSYNSVYYVTKGSFCPSVLFEVGFMTNPENYEDCTNTIIRYKTACAIAEAIVEKIAG